MPRPWLFSFALLVGLPVVAQAPVLSPTTSTVIDVDATFGHLTYAAIAIPAGVVVRFTGHYPVRVMVQGDVQIDGELSVAAVASFVTTESGPGSVTTGAGWTGYYWWVPGYWDPFNWVPGYWSGSPGLPGRHATMYGTAVPFDLAGGSPGGDVWYQSYWGPWQQQPGGYYYGGGGGGTLVIEAAGRIDVFGTVTADGAGSSYSAAGNGSGGSILLRGVLGCRVAAGATVTAMPEGIVRLDAYDLAPQVAGTVQPPPTIVRLPDLVETVSPVIGNTWQLRVTAPRGDVVFLAASFQPGSGTNQYGTLGIHLATAISFAVVSVPAIGHDPLATYQLAIPNAPGLVGLNLWVQGLDFYTSLPPRYTQTLHTSVL